MRLLFLLALAAPLILAACDGSYSSSDAPGDAQEPAGGYTLEVSPKTVLVKGKDAAGVFHGTRTILQLLPALGSEAWKDGAPEKLAAVEIKDRPRFARLGLMRFYLVRDVCVRAGVLLARGTPFGA